MRQPHIRAIGHLGFNFNFTQVACRVLSILVALGALAFVAWLYDYWRSEETVRVDVLVPSFFPLVAGLFVDGYELVSLLWFNRKRALNPVAICFDVALIGTTIFSFMVLSMVDDEPGSLVRNNNKIYASWASDMDKAMIFMIWVSLVRAAFIILTSIGIVWLFLAADREKKALVLARNQADIVGFYEMRGRGLPTVSPQIA
ncbi:hypothetical protein QBC38DRAFT_479512 [Podospora fimiseda]|uniref:Uncharacterized protein n=1 Tax=Podospora fimiseda TaxID=252190 RepID=A0AAN7BP26_9PEZI|nr:hypothetical protein QBC38DRAFT_479512 [Podospora fimiseda]